MAWRGLGDAVAAAAKSVGVKQTPGCGCKKRQETLNRWVPFRRNAQVVTPAAPYVQTSRKSRVGPMPAIAGGVGSYYYNSSEPGCDGSDPNVLFCDDFEHDGNGSTPGTWYVNDGDFPGLSAPAIIDKGWFGTIYNGCGPTNPTYPNCTLIGGQTVPPTGPITPFGASVCGSGVTPFGNCVGTGGFHDGVATGENMAIHFLKVGACGTNGAQQCQVSEIYVRWYSKWLSGYLFSGEKHLDITVDTGDIGFVDVQINCGAGQPSPTGTPYLQVYHGNFPNYLNCGAQNQGNDIAFQSGRWYFQELHCKVGTSNNAVLEYWANDCGVDGTSCGSAPILRTRYINGNLPGNVNGSQITTVFLENWANSGNGVTCGGFEPLCGSHGTGPYWDMIKASRVGPIGFAGAVASPTVTITSPTSAATYITTSTPL